MNLVQRGWAVVQPLCKVQQYHDCQQNLTKKPSTRCKVDERWFRATTRDRAVVGVGRVTLLINSDPWHSKTVWGIGRLRALAIP